VSINPPGSQILLKSLNIFYKHVVFETPSFTGCVGEIYCGILEFPVNFLSLTCECLLGGDNWRQQPLICLNADITFSYVRTGDKHGTRGRSFFHYLLWPRE